MALIPVCRGSFTGWRSTTPGAMRSTGNDLSVTIGPLAVDGLRERVYHAADQCFTDRHFHDAARALHLIAFANFRVLSEKHDSDLTLFQIQREAHDVMRKREKFSGHDSFQAVNARDAVTDGNHGSDFTDIDSGAVAIDLLADNFADFVCFDLHAVSSISVNLE